MTVGVQTPEVGARRGERTHIELAGVRDRERALGQPAERHERARRRLQRPGGQRANQVSDDVYGGDVEQLPQSRGVRPARAGTFGNYVRNSLVGPGFWNIDLAISRICRWAPGTAWSCARRPSTC